VSATWRCAVEWRLPEKILAHVFDGGNVAFVQIMENFLNDMFTARNLARWRGVSPYTLLKNSLFWRTRLIPSFKEGIIPFKMMEISLLSWTTRNLFL
jgi:hypothetical protein